MTSKDGTFQRVRHFHQLGLRLVVVCRLVLAFAAVNFASDDAMPFDQESDVIARTLDLCTMAFRIEAFVSVCILADTSILFEVEGCGDMSILVFIVIVLQFHQYASSL